MIAVRDDDRAPLAVSVLESNTIGAPPGVKVWNTEVKRIVRSTAA